MHARHIQLVIKDTATRVLKANTQQFMKQREITDLTIFLHTLYILSGQEGGGGGSGDF